MSEAYFEMLNGQREYWETKEAIAQRAVDYAGKQLEKIASKAVEMAYEGKPSLYLISTDEDGTL